MVKIIMIIAIIIIIITIIIIIIIILIVRVYSKGIRAWRIMIEVNVKTIDVVGQTAEN